MSDGTDDDQETLGKLLLIGLAVLMVPAVLPEVRAAVSAWLLEHHVLAPPEAALIPIPFMDGGLDLRRLVIVAVIVIGAVWLGHHHKETRHKGRGASRA